VISPRFGDIFRNNSTKSGLIPVQVDAATGAALLRAVVDDPSLDITIDVERGTLSVPALGIEVPFPLDAFTRHRLLEGLDDIGLSLAHAADIDRYELRRPSWLPAVTA
jgi:3-isopropylmalate/(R)-2-methylmalate dehydratase small subunit